MVKKPTRLRFTEKNLSDSKVQKTAARADKAVDKLVSKKKSAKLRQETGASGANYAQTECQFRYCGTAIPFLTVRSTAR